MQINVSVTDANNIVCEVVPPQPQVIVIDRGVEGNGIVSIVPVTISTFQYLRITYTNGTVQDVGPLTSTAYTATSPITIVGNTISLATVPIASGGTDATTAAGAIQNLLPSYTGNANKRLGLNSGGTALEWVADGGGTVTSINASGGTTGLTFSGGPITSSGTLTLSGTLAIANGGTGQITANAAFNALVPSQIGNSGKYLTTDGTDTSWATNPLGTVTSVAATVPSFLSVSGSPITTSGTLAITYSGTALPIANGGTGQTTANAALNALLPTQTGNSGKYLTTDGTDTSWATNPLGTVTSVAMTTPTGLTVSGSPITTSGTLALTMTSGYAIPTTTSQTNWDTAYSERQQWDGGSTNLVAATGRTSLGATTLGSNIFTISNPSAVTFPRFNADNTISALDAATFRTAIGAGTSSTTGTVTSVSGTGTVNGLTLTGTVTTSGSLTLGGTLNLSSPPAIGNTTPSTGNFTTLTENSVAVVTQSDIGSAPNEIPLNQYLGSLAYQNGDGYYNTGMTVGFRNRIINGAMVIDQRNAGAAVTSQNFAVDRFQTIITAVSSAALSSQQVTDAPSNSGFIYSYKYTVTTAATSFSSGGRTGILYRIEGYDFADFVFGTTNAKPITFSFWVKSSVTGTYSIGFSNADSTRGYPATYTINSANTWEYKTIVIGGCVDGTWLTTNGRGIQVEFCLGADTSRLGTANIWNNAFVTGATGTTQLVNTVNATFQITGVQLEKGNIATSFDVRPYGTELQLCQRYFESSFPAGTVAPLKGSSTTSLGSGSQPVQQTDWLASFTSGTINGFQKFIVPKRASPTMTFFGTSNDKCIFYDFGTKAIIYPAFVIASSNPAGFNGYNDGTGLTNNTSWGFDIYNWSASAEL